MLKKFVSNALLSVVMDKGARRKLADRQALKSSKQPDVQKTKPVTKAPAAESDEDVLSTITDALAEARAEIASGNGASTNGTENKQRRFEPSPSARSTLPGKPAGKTKAGSPARDELIKQAMSIHHQKQQVLDDLPEETREKLMVMAMYAMDPSSLPPETRSMVEAEIEAEKSSSGGPVDDIGGGTKNHRRKR